MYGPLQAWPGGPPIPALIDVQRQVAQHAQAVRNARKQHLLLHRR